MFFDVRFHTKFAAIKKICAVLTEKQCNSKIYCKVTQGCKKENSSKNNGFRYEMIGETQPEMEL